MDQEQGDTHNTIVHTASTSKRPKETCSSSSDTDVGTDSEIFHPVKPKGRKHRRVMPNHPEVPAPTATSNRFTTLATLKPPPIVLPPHYTDMTALIQKLNKEGCQKYTIQRCKSGNKIFCDDQATYDTVKEKLTNNKTQYYTFTPKGVPKDQLYVLLGLDSDHPLENIKAQVNSKHLKSVKRMTKTNPDGTRVPIPPVLLTFGPKFDPNFLKSITSIDQIIVYFRTYREEKGIAQCFRCQRFGHTKNNCNLRERCVRCGKHHAAKDCDRAQNPLHCPNCGQEHPASYRQCPARLELLGRSRSARQITISPPTTAPRTYTTINPNTSYAQATKQAPQGPQTRQPLLPTPDVPPQHPIHPLNTPHSTDGTPAWVLELTKNMTDMMNMLMTQFTTLMNLMNRLLPK